MAFPSLFDSLRTASRRGATKRGRRRDLPRQRASQPRVVEPLEGRTLLSAGQLDTSFNGSGKVTTAFAAIVGYYYGHPVDPGAPAEDQATAVATQADGKLVVAGTTLWFG